ncbi:hypothetical protein CIRMBP1270_01665 [Enterococcus cecorum]|nr:hypothetical protein CIRMBP1303_00254 [Enterococcus cecorum]CAI3402457.1 hypothetical protein CIRMBP1270_01665 [Enterococcus cecorum]CAI3414865.1 hypothetical protein CIRMBP1244_01698 [Enterococcus cecorum]CAI3444067.1 hypothetical protein CIRMBP1207_02081 [Enterococcus cecorum]CAI3474949.1 hypothetical protein CIRMBP1300_01758 [Enterococcus cecorum]
MKEYIYFDEDLINSTLAQLDKGLIKNISEGDEQTNSQSESNSKDSNFGLDGIFGVGVQLTQQISKFNSTEYSATQNRMLEYALNDYSVDLIISKIAQTEKFVDDVTQAEEGKIIVFSGEFSIYDFDLIKQITDESIVSLLVDDNYNEKDVKKLESQINQAKNRVKKQPQLAKDIRIFEERLSEIKSTIDSNKKAKTGYNLINKVSKVADSILGGSIFIKSDNSLSLCKRECFRLSQGQLALLTESKRKINILAIVTAIKDEIHPEGITGDFEPNNMNSIPSLLTDIFLSNFNMISKGDRILTPMAIFFE